MREIIAAAGLMGTPDIVESNPAFDAYNRNGKLPVDLVESHFGKSTLIRY